MFITTLFKNNVSFWISPAGKNASEERKNCYNRKVFCVRNEHVRNILTMFTINLSLATTLSLTTGEQICLCSPSSYLMHPTPLIIENVSIHIKSLCRNMSLASGGCKKYAPTGGKNPQTEKIQIARYSWCFLSHESVI